MKVLMMSQDPGLCPEDEEGETPRLYVFFNNNSVRGSRLFEIAKRCSMLKQDKDVSDLSGFSMIRPNVSEKAMKRSRRKGLLFQPSMNLFFGYNNLSDWSKNWHKVKTLLKSM